MKTRNQQIPIYDEILTVVKSHCSLRGNISLTEFVNSTLADALGIPFKPKRGHRPFYARDDRDRKSGSEAIRRILDDTSSNLTEGFKSKV